MSLPDFPIPETRVLAVASHVVSGHVGNKIAAFVLQVLGCDVATLNTVQFSNHTGYGRWTGSRVSAEEISDLWEGLKQSRLDDLDMMLSGYIPGAAAVEAVGRIGRELREGRSGSGPGSFFWVLDPVMGDNGLLYVAGDVVAAYKQLVPHSDLILPNQFEAELLSGVKIVDMATMCRAVQTLHDLYSVPHIIITSVDLAAPDDDHPDGHLRVVGSTRTSAGRARPFKIAFPAIDCYFSGTGDMFAALTVVRMREAVGAAGGNLLGTASWVSPDEVPAVELPLARAAEKVIGSMHQVLAATKQSMRDDPAVGGVDQGDAKQWKMVMSKAAEVKLVRNTPFLRNPEVKFKATAM